MAHPVLSRLVLQRFRSLRSEQVEFDNPTFLVGQNGSGKSNFADAFALLGEAMIAPPQAVLEHRGGLTAVANRSSATGRPSNLGLAVELRNPDADTVQARYAFELRPLKGYSFGVVREQCVVKRSICLEGTEVYHTDRGDQDYQTHSVEVDFEDEQGLVIDVDVRGVEEQLCPSRNLVQ